VYREVYWARYPPGV